MDEKDVEFIKHPIVLRNASSMDSEAVDRLLEKSYSHLLASSYDANMLELALPYMVKANPKLLTSGTYYVAEIDPSTLVGCGGWTPEAPGIGQAVEGEGHVRHFAVHPDWIKRRIGTTILARCVIDAKSAGIHKLHCISTLNAEPFYRASGFRTIGSFGVRMGPTIEFPALMMQREI